MKMMRKVIVMTKQAKMTEAIWERRILITPPRTSKNKEDDDAIEVYMCRGNFILGIIYSEHLDAIKEGNGLGVMRCWKFLT